MLWSFGDNFKVLSLREYNLQQAYRSRPAGVLRDDLELQVQAQYLPSASFHGLSLGCPEQIKFQQFSFFPAPSKLVTAVTVTGRKKDKDHPADAFFDVFNSIKMMLTCEALRHSWWVIQWKPSLPLQSGAQMTHTLNFSFFCSVFPWEQTNPAFPCLTQFGTEDDCPHSYVCF